MIKLNKKESKRQSKGKTIICLALAFLAMYLPAQNTGSYRYITSQQDSCIPRNMDAIEIDGYYYLLTDMITFNFYLERIPTVTVFDENLNKIKEICLFEGRVKIMPFKYFYKNDFFHLMGFHVINGYEKPFLMKFDKDFNIVQPLITYTLEDTFNYGPTHVIMNKDNEFIYSLYDIDFSHNRLLHIGNDGVLQQDISISQGGYRSNIAEINDYYYMECGTHLLRFCKDSFDKVDSINIALHADDVPDGSLIAVGNQLIRSNMCYVFHDECGEYPPLEMDRSVVFLDTNMEVQNRLEFGNPCVGDLDTYWNISYINPDSIYYIYETTTRFGGESIGIANFSHDGQLNFNYILELTEDSLKKTVFGCKATSDGGVLVFGSSRNTFTQSPAKGFLLKYHPQKNDLTVKEFSLEISSIKVYPNPAQTQFTVTNAQNAVLRLYNTLGQEVLQTHSKEENVIINISNLPQGLYVLKVEKENAVLTRKVQIIK
jgi:hypothetical protein